MESHEDRLAMKRSVHFKLVDKLTQEIVSLKETVGDIQDSANQETKSSAGDKYETGRAMAHLEAEKIIERIAEKEKFLGLVKALPDDPAESCRPGSLVWTTMGCVYISVSAGELSMDFGKVVCISPASPLALALREKRTGESFTLMKKAHTINQLV